MRQMDSTKNSNTFLEIIRNRVIHVIQNETVCKEDVGTYLVEFRNLLMHYKELGGLRDKAYSMFDGLMKEYADILETDENKYDIVRDEMDLIWGFCSPHNRIWPDEFQDHSEGNR